MINTSWKFLENIGSFEVKGLDFMKEYTNIKINFPFSIRLSYLKVKCVFPFVIFKFFIFFKRNLSNDMKNKSKLLLKLFYLFVLEHKIKISVIPSKQNSLCSNIISRTSFALIKSVLFNSISI